MKKFSVFLSLVLIASLLAGCAGTPVIYHEDCTCPTETQSAPAADTTPAPTEAPAPSEAPVEGALKTGLVIATNVKDSASATADAEGEAKYDVTVVAVLVDENGVIQDCIIDGISTSVKFDASGAITTDLTQAPLTKNELGENYNMVTYGGAIAEWDAQAASLAQFAIGKTVEELKNGAIDETGYAPEGSDLASSATIYLGGYVSAIEAAVAKAEDLGAQAGDELKLAVIAGIGDSTAADAENAGNAQLNVDATALTMNGDVITSCVIDSVQAKVSFDAEGKITSDTSAAVATKNELGENYNMVKYGGAIAEWNEQAASFASYVTGKTPAEVAGIAVDESTHPTGADLASSVTIAVGGFQALITKAAVVDAAAPTAGNLKTGLAIATNVKDSASATAEAEGEAKYDVTVVAVLVDENGVIQNCIIDGISTSVKFDVSGAITTDLTQAPLTKNELGENYNMVTYGGAIAEWDAQAAALASFAVGKTVEELKNGAVDETGYAPECSDLASSATIYLGGYVSAIEAAVANAQDLGAQVGDELKLAVITGIGDSTAADAENAGNAQLNVDATALTMNGDVITSCVIDSVQAKVSFDAEGKITSDTSAAVATKNELGENYNMVKYGGAIAEWNEQAASFASYVTGKTPAEVAGIAVDESTHPTGADLASSVTIAIGGFQALIAKACG